MPSWKEEIRRFRNRYIRKHGANNTHHLVLHLAIWKSLDSYRQIILFQKNEICNFEVKFWEASDVTYDYSQLQLRRRFLTPEGNLDGPSFAR